MKNPIRKHRHTRITATATIEMEIEPGTKKEEISNTPPETIQSYLSLRNQRKFQITGVKGVEIITTATKKGKALNLAIFTTTLESK